MIQFVDTAPEFDVEPARYLRLLGYPRHADLSPRAAELAAWAREWYRVNGRPWTYAREASVVEIADPCISIDGARFTSPRLCHTLRQADAHSVVLVAVGAGPELERESQKLWREEKPDEYFFLESFGSAVVEQLTAATRARLDACARRHQMAVLPHYSPGYRDWDIAQQTLLLALIKDALPRPLEVLESGMLRPKKSQLAVFGLTTPRYRVNLKALEKWAAERLSLHRDRDGAIHALFRFEGTTCTNLGRPLDFEYRVKLGPREEGYPIREQQCAPAAADAGHTSMCEYLANPDELMNAIDREKPLLGRPLHDALTWPRPNAAPGCYCEPASRDHKWALVFETIHYALFSLAPSPWPLAPSPRPLAPDPRPLSVRCRP